MFAWLITLPLWLQISIVIIFGLIFLYFLIFGVLPLLMKGITVKEGNRLFSFGIPSNLCTQGTLNCPFRKDLFIFLNESSRLFHEKHTIVFVSQIKDQMNYAEQKVDQIRLKLHSIYLTELRESGSVNLVQSESFLSYKYILKEIQKDILSRFRYFFRENHFDQQTETEFNIYINGKFDYLASEFTDMLNDAYYDNSIITRESLYKVNTKHILDIKPFVVDIFQNARTVSIDYNLKLLEIDEKIDNLMKRFIK